MISEEHSEYARIRRRALACKDSAITSQGIFYRSVTVPYASTAKDILSGMGSFYNGGRWSGIKTFPTVYTSSTPETALAESLEHYRYYGIPIHQALPRVFVAITVSLQKILDLTDAKIRQRFRISLRRMIDEPWRNRQDMKTEALTQAIARACHEAGYEGIKVPSAPDPQGSNLIVFPLNLLPTSSLTIVNAAKLPGRPRTS